MKWTLSQLQKYRSKDFSFDEIVNVDEVVKMDAEIRDASPMRITGRADIDSEKVIIHFKMEGHLILPCSRTLVDVKYPINVETIETFLLKASDYETEEEVHQVQGDVIDMMPIIHELLVLEVPMQVFCDDSGEEGAPQSGKDWEVISEQEKTEKIDPRLAGLAQLLNQKDSSDS
ncbi:YceD family protein [Cytobacillus kochii]|uniref:YceD family protein n=1 Tax=Cytobacillus kochii TaxID=859143 RepID=UPI001CD26142|nr:YceD family protein [Cytobacillus kochii]MCA1028355.1 YceD family protein [Cytobacillus kochii]MCM3321823.1 YceD family protein [Cytobacillus kochii]MCM3343343.1 YceD family protein [Cytobacillus kochii]MDM5207173.1 YceD family protein [Cytobacillus kochii]